MWFRDADQKPVNIGREMRAVSDVIVRTLRVQAIREARERARAEMDRLLARKGRAEAEDRDRVASLEHTVGRDTFNRLLLVTAIALTLLDIPIQFLAGYMSYPDAGIWVWAGLSPAVTLGVAILARAFALTITYGLDTSRPARAARRCLVFGSVAFVFVGVSGTGALIARTPSVALIDVLPDLFNWSIWVLAESLPITAGFLSAALYARRMMEPDATLLANLESRIGDLQRFVAWLDADERNNQPVPHPAPNSTPRPEHALEFAPPMGAPRKGNGASTAPIVLLALLLGAGTASAEVLGSAVTSCAVLADATSSLDAAGRAVAIRKVAESLPGLVDAYGCGPRLRVGTFADEGPFAPVDWVRVPESTPVQCEPEPPATGVSRVLGMNPQFRMEIERRRKVACEEKERQYQAAIDAAWSELQQRVKQSTQAVEPRGACTGLKAVVRHFASAPGRFLLVVSDAAESCDPAGELGEIQGRVVMVLVPSNGDLRQTSAAALRRADEWRRLVRDLQILTAGDLSRDVWAEIARIPARTSDLQ